MHVVIIGNGVAGIEAARRLRELEAQHGPPPGADALQITVVSEESDHFFSRTALMWVHCGQLSHADTEPFERDLYQRLHLQRVRARVAHVDVTAKRLRFAGDAPELAYDKLLIASGSRPRPGPWPGSESLGVGSFVTHQDLAWYQEEVTGRVPEALPPRPFEHASTAPIDSPYRPRETAAKVRGRGARELAVIGGGLIGIEAVEVAVSHGLRPRFFIREEWFWPMAIDARESAWVAQRMGDHGVEVLIEHDVKALKEDGEGCVAQVCTDRGDYAAEAVVVAIGVVPNTGFLAGAALERDRSGGIVVDENLSTSAPDVFAAGDCASVLWKSGARRPEQLWYTGRDQGRAAAENLFGRPHAYRRQRIYNSAKLMDIEYTTAGEASRNVADGREDISDWYFEETGQVRSTTRIVLEGDRVIGFNLLGRRWDHTVLLDWIEAGRTLDWVLQSLSSASFDTEFVPPLRLSRAAGTTSPLGSKEGGA